MATPIDICNAALSLAGEIMIIDFYPGQDSELSRICTNHYSVVRDSVIELGSWNSCVTRVSLARLEEVPAFGWNYMYALPNDPKCLHVLEMKEEESGQQWTIESYSRQPVLLTDSSTATIRYVYREENPAFWTPNLAQAITYRLGAAICVSRGRNQALAGQLMSIYSQIIRDAARMNFEARYPVNREKYYDEDLRYSRG